MRITSQFPSPRYCHRCFTCVMLSLSQQVCEAALMLSHITNEEPRAWRWSGTCPRSLGLDSGRVAALRLSQGSDPPQINVHSTVRWDLIDSAKIIPCNRQQESRFSLRNEKIFIAPNSLPQGHRAPDLGISFPLAPVPGPSCLVGGGKESRPHSEATRPGLQHTSTLCVPGNSLSSPSLSSRQTERQPLSAARGP